MDFLISVFRSCGKMPASLILVLTAITVLLICAYFTEKYYEDKSK